MYPLRGTRTSSTTDPTHKYVEGRDKRLGSETCPGQTGPPSSFKSPLLDSVPDGRGGETEEGARGSRDEYRLGRFSTGTTDGNTTQGDSGSSLPVPCFTVPSGIRSRLTPGICRLPVHSPTRKEEPNTDNQGSGLGTPTLPPGSGPLLLWTHGPFTTVTVTTRNEWPVGENPGGSHFSTLETIFQEGMWFRTGDVTLMNPSVWVPPGLVRRRVEGGSRVRSDRVVRDLDGGIPCGPEAGVG